MTSEQTSELRSTMFSDFNTEACEKMIHSFPTGTLQGRRKGEEGV